MATLQPPARPRRRGRLLPTALALLTLLGVGGASARGADRPATKAEALATLQAAEHLRLVGVAVPPIDVRVTLDGAECDGGSQPAYACVRSEATTVWLTTEAAGDARVYHAALRATNRLSRAQAFYACQDACLYAPSVGLHEAVHVARFARLRAARQPWSLAHEEGLAEAVANDQLPRMVRRITGAKLSVLPWAYEAERGRVLLTLTTPAARLAAIGT